MAKKSQKQLDKLKQENQKRQVRLTIGIVAAVTVCIAAGVFFLNRGPKLADPAVFGEGVQVFGQVDLNNAKLACSKFTRVSFGDRLKYLAMDNRSSRFDPKKKHFRVFMEGELYPEDGSRKTSDPYYFNCSSSADSLVLEEFEVIKIEPEEIKVGRKREGSRYGWQ